MRALALLLLLATPLLASADPIGPLHAKDAAKFLKQTVTVRGVVTGVYSTEKATRLYLQDASGGICLYGAPVTCAALGDSVEVSGAFAIYGGLTELSGRTDAPLTFKKLGRAAIEPAAAVRTITQLLHTEQADGSEPDESRLVQLRDVFVRMSDGAMPADDARFEAEKNYRLVHAGADSSGSYAVLRVQSGDGCEGLPSLVGAALPHGAVHVTGVLSQHGDRETGKGGYQILPRIPADVAPAGK